MKVLPDVYWHLADPRSFILHNAFVGKGLVRSASLTAEIVPGVGTQYGELNAEPDKEKTFESIRIKHYPDRPSRRNCLFCFPAREDAERASASWFKNQGRLLLELQIVDGSNFFCADSAQLNAAAEDWENAAHRYWSGDDTDNPHHEVIVHGMVFFAGWQNKPFGLFANIKS